MGSLMRVYLDHNATTGMNEQIASAVHVMQSLPLNPSSVHQYGREAKSILEDARNRILHALSLERGKYSLIFTSSGTEANNLIVKNFYDVGVVMSSVEHSSMISHTKASQRVIMTGVDKEGRVDLIDLEQKIQEHSAGLISIMMANNETGIIAPLDGVIDIARKYRAMVHSDCVQALGKMDLRVDELGLDAISISSHKIGGPRGMGALIYRSSYSLAADILGGGQEMGLRSGTENVAGALGFAIAVEAAEYARDKNCQYMEELRNYLESSLPDAMVIGKNIKRLPNTSMIVMHGVSSKVQVMRFDQEGVSVSAGSACSSGRISTSHVLMGMGIDNDLAGNAIRVSLGISNTKEEIDRFVEIWKKIYMSCSKK